MEITTIILLILAFMAKAIMDISAMDGFNSYYWNKTESWENKYAFPLVKDYKHWYYFGIMKTKYKERFFMSTTFFVAFTDGWHLAQFVFLNCIFMAIAINTDYIIISFIGIRLLYAIIFNSIFK